MRLNHDFTSLSKRNVKTVMGFVSFRNSVYMTYVAPFLCYFIIVSCFLREVTQGKGLKNLLKKYY